MTVLLLLVAISVVGTAVSWFYEPLLLWSGSHRFVTTCSGIGVFTKCRRCGVVVSDPDDGSIVIARTSGGLVLTDVDAGGGCEKTRKDLLAWLVLHQ